MKEGTPALVPLRVSDMALVKAAPPKVQASTDDDVQVFRVSGGVAQPDSRSSFDIEAQAQRAADPAPRPAPVISLPVQMQHGFVRKSLGLLVIQLFAELAIGAGIVWFVDVEISNLVALCLLMASLVLLIALSSHKDKYPGNMALLALYTIVTGVALGFTHPYWKSSSQFQILGYLNAGLAGVWLSSNFVELKSEYLNRNGDYVGSRAENVVHMQLAGQIGGAFALVAAIVTLVVNGGPPSGHYGHWIASIVFGVGLTYWFANDTHAIMENLGPDEYLLSTVHFYADLLKLLMCCFLTAMFCGSGGNSN